MLVLLLALAAGLSGQGKVILEAGTAGAEFYLDGNFVDKANDDGLLVMESFPAGSFKFTVKKTGYATHRGWFTIAEGQTKTLKITLTKNKSIIPKSATATPPKKTTAVEETPRPQPAPAKTGENMPAPVSPEEETPFSLPWIFGGALAVLLVGSYWYWSQKRRQRELEFARQKTQAFEEHAEPAPQTASRPAPEFIEELRRKEELMNAGFVGTKPREIDRQTKKGKEVVIVLPKEAYRYEEEP